MEVILSPFAKQSLSRIAAYITEKFSPLVSFRAMLSIRSYIKSLGNTPHVGKRIEEWSLHGEVRCVVYRQNQIYYVVHPNRMIIIVVWDTRQSQEQLKRVIAKFFEECTKQ